MNKYDELIERAKRFTDTAIVGELINAVSELKDRESVVHCKDCKHYKVRNQSAHWKAKALQCCRSANTKRLPNDFCSYGERKEDG